MADADAPPCDQCSTPTADALARTLRLTVDRSQVDAQRLCPECFAEWIERYEDEMTVGASGEGEPDDDADIIVD